MKIHTEYTSEGTIHIVESYGENETAIAACFEPDKVQPPASEWWVRLDQHTAKRAVVGGWLYVTEVYGGGVCYVPDPSAPHVANDAETRIRKARKVYADTIERSNDGHPVNFDTIAGIMDLILAGDEP